MGPQDGAGDDPGGRRLRHRGLVTRRGRGDRRCGESGIGRENHTSARLTLIALWVPTARGGRGELDEGSAEAAAVGRVGHLVDEAPAMANTHQLRLLPAAPGSRTWW
jgi:hypothetical protein